MKTIAIIEDDIHIGNLLEEVLQKAGYQTLRAYSGTEALYMLSHHWPDLILLDLMLPGMSGEEVLSRVKDIPVIVVSAKADVQDKIKLLLGGAVDYVTKPFSTEELLARISVNLRKSSASPKGEVLHVNDLTMDHASHEVRVKDTLIHLTRTEYAILKLLMMNPDQVMTKTVMLERISMDTPDCTESSLRQHMSNLRKKLREAGDKAYIEAVWGIGFKLES